MKTHLEKTRHHALSSTQAPTSQNTGITSTSLTVSTPSAYQSMANNSTRVKQLQSYQQMTNGWQDRQQTSSYRLLADNSRQVKQLQGYQKEADVMGAKAMQVKATGTTPTQMSAKNTPVQRQAIVQMVSKEVLAGTIGEQKPIERELLAGVLDQPNLNAAIYQIYCNMFRLGSNGTWHYQAGSKTNGQQLLDSEQNTGMCQSYSQAFELILNRFNVIKNGYAPFDGDINAEMSYDMANTSFVTHAGLALLGNQSGYNVTKVVDGSSGNESPEHRYLFNNHWQLRVNGCIYDPLFEGINVDNVAYVLGNSMFGIPLYYAEDDQVAFLSNGDGPTANREFNSQFSMITGVQDIHSIIGRQAIIQRAHRVVKLIAAEVKQGIAHWDVEGPNMITDSSFFGSGRQQPVKEWSSVSAYYWSMPLQGTTSANWLQLIDELRELLTSSPLNIASATPDITNRIANSLLQEIKFLLGGDISRHIKDMRNSEDNEGIVRKLTFLEKGLTDLLNLPVLKEI